MITPPDFIAIALAAVALYQVWELRKQHNARLTTLERQQKQARPEYIGGSKMPMPPEKVEVSISKEPPKAGTVAAKAIKPVVYLSQVPHKTVQLDNGGLEWEGKI